MASAQTDGSYQVGDVQAARQEFAQRFDDLYRAAGSPSLRGIAVAAKQRMRPDERSGGPSTVSAQRISDWKAGRNVPARFETLRAVLVVLGLRARRKGAAAPELLDLRSWRRLWDTARSPRPARVADPNPVHNCRSEPSAGYFGLAGISLGCDDLGAMVGFYMQLLDGKLLWSNDDNAAVRICSGVTVVVHRVSEYVTPVWPGTPIVHFGVTGESDVAEYETRALRMGARVAGVRPESGWRVLLDPAGHPFCLTACGAQA